LLVPVFFLVQIEAAATGTSWIKNIPMAAGIYLIVVFLLYNVRSWLSLLKRPVRSAFPIAAKHSINLLVITTCLMLYISWFARTAYPIISEQFGGGRPKKCKLVFALESASLVSQMGIPNAAGVSEPISVLYEADSWVVIRLRDGRALSIDKKLVRGIETLDTNQPRLEFRFLRSADRLLHLLQGRH
jgi:hypothetical protein